jgi:D-beta-D-heptose 7-phosphate kinase/D-beta-D-heptose 1-phosphate adenosyltransferase
MAKILVIGDACTDIYKYGSVDRISPEAPVPVFKFIKEEQFGGMAVNVYNNLRALGNEVHERFGEFSIKTRMVDIKSRQHLIRLDTDVISNELSSQYINDQINDYDAIVISDYNKGFVSYDTIEYIRRNYHGPMFLDTKKQDLARFHGIYVKINELEYSQRYSVNDQLIVTLGSRGVMYRNFNNEELYTTPVVEVADVVGAGDTFLAALAHRFIETRSISDSIPFAAHAAAVTVQHFGVYSPSKDEIERQIQRTKLQSDT